MRPWELFRIIHTRRGYRHIGKDLSWKDFIDHENGKIYICFQGSNGLRDWLHNLLAIPSGAAEPYRGCGWRVHKGFARVWRSGNDTVIQEARGLWEKFRRSKPLPCGGWGAYDLAFCGYSHGAALAQLAAEDYAFRFGGASECECFGSPKLAWGDAAKRHLQRSMFLTNWINRADAVTALPPRALGYRHVAEHLLSVRRIPFLSMLRIRHHHETAYGLPEAYP